MVFSRLKQKGGRAYFSPPISPAACFPSRHCQALMEDTKVATVTFIQIDANKGDSSISDPSDLPGRMKFTNKSKTWSWESIESIESAAINTGDYGSCLIGPSPHEVFPPGILLWWCSSKCPTKAKLGRRGMSGEGSHYIWGGSAGGTKSVEFKLKGWHRSAEGCYILTPTSFEQEKHVLHSLMLYSPHSQAALQITLA